MSDRAEREDRVDATGEEATGMTDEDPGTQKAAVSAPEKEQPTVKAPLAKRTTAPQSPYSMRQAGIGAAVLLVGLLVTFAVPLLLL
ncbi:DUF7550 family protein [Halalkalicoccus jeotgali]|uniref:Uncharacterized protein n=1 Tax=Halalkalicoccus jeotgali (strain DSM 18796 / CECT 7217 / JCM 14584 / KCTC 4019 / B3) TaxID=795797 RepID=D8J3X1_HALJB|nr:hypothetical protein [Halalkalicoccus jeotgali]ADJ15363.1 hypothetical protein HacjB3_09900 [Halalkalicoccus jeotgali B3]ELY35424.1 hypothetical protein C497_12776 [Halalkalicoccus jeotgali B3]